MYSYGSTIYAVSKSPGPLKELKEKCPNIITICLDLSNWDETRTKLLNLPDKIDGLVNNAGIAIIKPFMELTEKDFDEYIIYIH